MGAKKVAEVMDFLQRVVRYLFWLLVVSWSAWLLKKALAWMLRKAVGPGGSVGGQYGYGGAAPSTGGRGAVGGATPTDLAPRKLVRDPVCGVYLAEVLAIPLRDGGQLLHFCSIACRDKYAVQVQRRAANG
jgi:hypothetical protein